MYMEKFIYAVRKVGFVVNKSGWTFDLSQNF
jgi:hypothetical protein